MNAMTWLVIAGVAGLVLATVLLLRHAQDAAKRPVPVIDRSVSYTATVHHHELGDIESGSVIVMVEYEDADGQTRRAGLADVIHHSWIDRFEPGTQWQVYAYTVPGPRVVLTEAHEDVWRSGWNLDGVHHGGSRGPVGPGPGSPFPYRPRGYGS